MEAVVTIVIAILWLMWNDSEVRRAERERVAKWGK